MVRIGIASNDWSQTTKKEDRPVMGGSGWIRLGQYLPYMTNFIALGKLALIHGKKEFAVQDWNNEFYKDLDIVVMQRYMNAELANDLVMLRGRRRNVVVQDIDDWYWGLDRRNHAAKAASPQANPTNNIIHYKKVIQHSDYVITSTPYLADRISGFYPADRIRIQENHTDFSKFKQRKHTERDKPLIGWFGSTAHRSGDLQILRGVVSQIQNQFRFVHVGDMSGKGGLWADGTERSWPAFHKEIGIQPGSMAYMLPLMPHDQLVQRGFDYDIGIVPLNIMPFNQSKSWIKGLEYIAAGIPFIASPSSEYLRFHDEYGVGRIAEKPKDWLRHLDELRDPETRQQEAIDNFSKVQSLDTKLGAKELEDTLLSFL